MLFTENTIIGDILDRDSSCEAIFLDMEMHCMGCPAARGETLREACAIHGVDEQELLRRLREHVKR